MENFIERSKEKFGDTFDFSKSTYINYKIKMEFFCKNHNEKIFLSPERHFELKFGGCNVCKSSMKEIEFYDEEIGRDVNIPEYKDFYIITNIGRCFSKITNKELLTQINGGYKIIGLWNRNSKLNNTFKIHFLVYITFKNDHDKNKVIDHIDGNKLNNKISNLRCVSFSENVKNAYINNPNMRRSTPICMFNKNDVFVKEFNSINDGMIFIGHKSSASIYNCLKGITKSVGGYIWKYKNIDVIEKKINDIKDYDCIGKIEENDFSNYYINANGIIINKKYKNRMITSQINASGYVCFYLCCSITKNQKTFILHRLLGKYFLKDGNKYYYDDGYVVNHINENKSDNRLENLEWVTYRQNTVHSIGKKVAKINLENNKTIATYNSIADACRDLGFTDKRTTTISQVCKNKKGKKTAYGFGWKYAD